MNPLQQLEKTVKSRHPRANTALDAPQKPNGTWFLDIGLNGHRVVVEWNARHGFGVTAKPKPGYGEGADEVYADVDGATKAVLSLLLSRGRSKPPEAVRLRELRHECGLSQVELVD
jgi:hypothetical protein